MSRKSKEKFVWTDEEWLQDMANGRHIDLGILRQCWEKCKYPMGHIGGGVIALLYWSLKQDETIATLKAEVEALRGEMKAEIFGLECKLP